ncbi:MAG: enoyl-ACP reductase [Myxococcales bacterium]|nr:enoyl-ACP reductase [Myxococcales bacterium]
MPLLQGKRALVMGVASRQSIAWGIARALHREGAEIALSCQDERVAERVAKLAPEIDCDVALRCDVSSDAEIDGAFEALGRRWDRLDVLVHAIAHAPRETLRGGFLSGLSREAWSRTLEVSAYSLSAVTRAAHPLLGPGGAVLTLSYLGALRSVAHYNVMGPAKASLEASVRYLAAALGPEGIRVNAISAGPIRTLAASGIAGMTELLDHAARAAPIRRNVTIEDVGNAAAFLCSDLSSGITGEVVYVDGGLSTVGPVPGRP